ncbi:unnamed protein product, partial [Rotaria sp. Silwood1]
DVNHFNDVWLQKIRTDAGDNYRIKANNLKKILKNITDYYSEILGQSLVDFQMPDLNMIAETTDETELSRLLQLVLGCAVSCDRKQYYIEHIMLLEESVQHVLMNAIQELMVKEIRKNNEEYSELGDQLKHALEELNRVVEAKEEIEHRCRELDLQISTLQDDKFGLIQETTRLNERLQQYENAEDAESIPRSRYKTLQERIQSQQEEIFKLETTLQDYRAKLDVLQIKLNEKDIIISTKTSEINAMEERYVQYLEKAKMVLRQMDPRNSNSISHQEIQLLKKQIDEKDRRIKELEKDYEKMKAIREDQEKLLISAWYSLGSTFQRREFEERLKSHENQSFLAKQRTIPTTRKQLPPDPSNSSTNGTNKTSKR